MNYFYQCKCGWSKTKEYPIGNSARSIPCPWCLFLRKAEKIITPGGVTFVGEGFTRSWLEKDLAEKTEKM